VGGTSTGSTIHVILSDSEESSGRSRFLRFFVACRLLRMTVNGESLNSGYNHFDIQNSLFDILRFKLAAGYFYGCNTSLCLAVFNL
jgi:hypothetical protein